MTDFWIITKYADAEFNRFKLCSLEDSIYGTYTGDQLQVPRCFVSNAAAEKVLKQVRELNPSVSYGVVKASC